MAIIPLGINKSKVYEENQEIIIRKNPWIIIKESCSYFGSSYFGRHAGTKKMIGVTHKSPIIIEETQGIIFFPTTSPRLDTCEWINYKKLSSYFNKNGKTFLTLSNGKNLEIDVSFGTFNNQVLRSSYLDSVLNQRKLN